jgi:hypothetical protein
LLHPVQANNTDWQKKMKLSASPLVILPFLAGCWALTDVATNRDLDRSIPFGVEVQSGSISARTPVVHLIDEKKKNGISLRSVDIGVIAPDRYTAYRMNLAAFTVILENEKKIASDFRSYEVVLKGTSHTVYFLRFNQKNTVKLVYMVFLGDAGDGASVANTEYFFDTAFEGDRWWDKPPEFFLRFANSVEIKQEA